MKKIAPFFVVVMLVFCNCSKSPAIILEDRTLTRYDPSNYFTFFTIRAGQHFADSNLFKPVETAELKFAVKFDSSAVYQSASPINQYDINKLYGFSDNNAKHHQFSARFGWRWSDKALRLFAYVYNNGILVSKELGTIGIGKEVSCSIKVHASVYIFSVGEITEYLPRLSATPLAKGYLLYPYFGGDEPAPHDINIWIKNL
ncbi:MAG: hypothetical protein ABR503_08345 [Chitinophagaceae bacterium]